MEIQSLTSLSQMLCSGAMELKEVRANEDWWAEAVQGHDSGLFEWVSLPTLAYKLAMSEEKSQSSEG